ncbi:39S ribosomal protein L28, mitochondrial isoform X2 [Cryptotermes secundus]|uniref:39S ribosomal protein L28, mitochondrial isoform X2 n=1 Tax=Cryptotermes secundus TaxID=105785 RepID=UPI000CD7B586|nr:39S ribosomal protein L28, mitochondrial isoform X2 [Cryptotermes secundus]
MTKSNIPNRILKFNKPDNFSFGVAARLPEAYKKFWYEWKKQKPVPVHYIPEPGKWKRNPETGEVTPVQNFPIPMMFPNECHQGLWGGEGIVRGFQKRKPRRRRVPHYWFPTLHRSVIYSEILNKHMTVVVTMRALDLIHENYGLDHYILKTPACDLQSLLAFKLKRKMLLSLMNRDLYPDDPVKREDVYNTYKKYLGNYTEEEVEWYGLTMFEAIKKQMNREEVMNKPKPLKIMYRAELVEQLQAAGIEEVKAALEEYEGNVKSQKISSWLSKLNPFSSRK